MTDGANTPPAAETDLSHLGPATLEAVRMGVRACDRDIAVWEGIAKRRPLRERETKDLARARASRHKLLTQPYPPPYVERARHGANDSGSHSGEDDAAK